MSAEESKKRKIIEIYYDEVDENSVINFEKTENSEIADVILKWLIEEFIVLLRKP